ncbi:MAG: agmatine deiminase family protein [Verrucomicrobiales bacterium]|nr:agmatine deiminase family protein [Verrucomicrobiales bacterium]
MPEDRMGNPESVRRWPAEWEPHFGTWISWPNLCGESFEFGLAVIRNTMLEMVRALVPGEQVLINYTLESERSWLESQLSDEECARVQFFDVPFREPYLRDNGPVFVQTGPENKLTGIRWEFDGWSGKYPPHDVDNTTARCMAETVGFPIEDAGFVFEGGAIETNGQGLLLVSEPSFRARNPDFPKGKAEERFRELLGVNEITWLDCPTIPGDDTEGHVDVSTRFIDAQTIIVSGPDDYFETIRQLGFRTLRLPVPFPGWHPNREIETPASYANFYIGNEVVLVPVFDQPTDEEACEILASCFPGRKLVRIDANEIINGQGGIHCLTQTVPAPGF